VKAELVLMLKVTILGYIRVAFYLTICLEEQMEPNPLMWVIF